jgi:hypothetical protein
MPLKIIYRANKVNRMLWFLYELYFHVSNRWRNKHIQKCEIWSSQSVAEDVSLLECDCVLCFQHFRGPSATEQVGTTIVWNATNWSQCTSKPRSLQYSPTKFLPPAQHNLISSMPTTTQNSQHQEKYCYQNISERITLKSIFQKYDVKFCTGFMRF